MSRLERRFRRLGATLTLALCALGAHSQAGAQQFQLLHSFTRADGFGPMAGLVQGADGAVYGTTSQGGAADLGTVFRIDRKTLAFTTLHAFNGSDGSLLYGGLLAGADGALYGSTSSGGAGNAGTLFRLSTDGAVFSTLGDFALLTLGGAPDDLALLQRADGTIYGTTSTGGPGGGGTLFAFTPPAGTPSLQVAFAGAAGVDAGLGASDGVYLYGTTYSGGAYGLGSVFRVQPGAASVETLHDFTGTDGSNPLPGALMLASDGNLYGTTQNGGYGTVYQLSPSDRSFKTLHTFTTVNGEGRTPLGGLVDGGDGWLYGTTLLGGWGYGTVYRVQPGGAYGVVFRFGNSNGRMPSGNLLRGSDGWIYGITRVGGASSNGTVWRLSMDTTPPVIASTVASPSQVHATNKVITVNVAVAVSDAADNAPRCRITGVTANQTITNDWVLLSDLSLSLRARRSNNSDRVYTIAVQCSDASGNAATSSTTVTVVK